MPHDPNEMFAPNAGERLPVFVRDKNDKTIYVRLPVGPIGWDAICVAANTGFPGTSYDRLLLGVRVDSEMAPVFYIAIESYNEKLFLPGKAKPLHEIGEMITLFAEEEHAGNPDGVRLDPRKFPLEDWASIIDDER